jgi:hypothetical protein
MRLEKIQERERVKTRYFLDYLDYGDYYLLTKFVNSKNSVMITLNQNTVLENLHKEYGGDLSYSKFCKATFQVYELKKGYFESRNIDEVMSWTETDTYYSREGFLLEALITGKGLEKLNLVNHIVRWPNKNGGKGEHWYKLL